MAAVDLAAVVLGDTNIKPKDLISEIVQEHTADDFFLATGPQGDDVCVLFGFAQERAIDFSRFFRLQWDANREQAPGDPLCSFIAVVPQSRLPVRALRSHERDRSQQRARHHE